MGKLIGLLLVMTGSVFAQDFSQFKNTYKKNPTYYRLEKVPKHQRQTKYKNEIHIVQYKKLKPER